MSPGTRRSRHVRGEPYSVGAGGPLPMRARRASSNARSMSTITDCRTGHLGPKTVDALLRAAVLAPSSHNTQPRLFAVEPGSSRCAPNRRERAGIDPDNRELVMGCGAAL